MKVAKKIIIASLMAGMSHSVLAQTSIEKTLDENGVTACRDEVRKVTKFLAKDHGESSHVTWHTTQPNRRNVSAVMMKDYSDGDSHITFNMNPEGNACDWSYTETYFVPSRCTATREKMIADADFVTEMGDTAIYELGALDYYLTDLKQGCLVTKKESSYQ